MAGAARCDWHVGDLDLPDNADPLQDIAQLQSTAEVIDLTVTEDELFKRLDALVDKESRYFAYSKDDDGVTPLECKLKWEPHHQIRDANASLNCFNCPNFVSDKASARSLICNLGREQCNVIEQIRGLRIAATLEDELVAAYERDIEMGAELAEAWLATA